MKLLFENTDHISQVFFKTSTESHRATEFQAKIRQMFSLLFLAIIRKVSVISTNLFFDIS